MAKLRRKLHKWAYRSVLEKIEVYARRMGVQLIKVNPAYTSIIGKLKYSPMLSIDKDVAGAYVIARRGLGFEESFPRITGNYSRTRSFWRMLLLRWMRGLMNSRVS